MLLSSEKTHCIEVEKLMRGKMPFVTRHGITLVVIILVIVVIILLVLGGMPHQLMKAMIGQTLEQMKMKVL